MARVHLLATQLNETEDDDVTSETLLVCLEGNLDIAFLCLFNGPDQRTLFTVPAPQAALVLLVFTLSR
jgi:hypothetical protein